MLRKQQHLLTAKGRQQRKLMFKRRVLTKYLEFRRKGVRVPIKVIEQHFLEQEAQQYAEKYEKSKMNSLQIQINQRIANFNKNQEQTG